MLSAILLYGVRTFLSKNNFRAIRSEERREGKSVDLGGRRIIKKKNKTKQKTKQKK